MRRRLSVAAFLVLAGLLTLGWVHGAWQGPRDNYAFDFSINYTGARLVSVRGPDRPLYDRQTLEAEARPYTTFPRLYHALFLTYIQTPITAVVTLPFSRLDFDDARIAFLIFSNLLLLAAAALTVYVLRPSLLLVLAAFVILGTFEPMFESLRLGQVDAIIVFCLALSFAGLRRGSPALTGAPLALAAILKLSPAFVIGYFAWRRRWRVVAYAAGALAALLIVSVLIAGWDNNVTFVRDMVPRLMHGSPWFYNISIPGAVLRAYLGRGYWTFEDEPPALPIGLRLALIAVSAAIIIGTYVITRRDAEAGFMLSIAAGIMISPVSWTSYSTWLILSLLWLVRRFEDRRAWGPLLLLALLYPLLLVKPEDLAVLSDDIYAVPIKTIALIAYAGLIAWEGRPRRPEPEPAVLTGEPARAARLGAA